MKQQEEKNEMREIIAANIIRLRKAADITQSTLAKRTGLTHNFINDVERKNKSVSIETLGKLARSLEVEPYQLLITPKQWFNPENRQIIGFLETLHKSVDRIFEDSLKEFNVGNDGN